MEAPGDIAPVPCVFGLHLRRQLHLLLRVGPLRGIGERAEQLRSHSRLDLRHEAVGVGGVRRKSDSPGKVRARGFELRLGRGFLRPEVEKSAGFEEESFFALD